jgi:hypothetical protein
MVVDDFDIAWASFLPFEADAPLVVYADAVFSGAIAAQCFQPVAGRHAQIQQYACVVQHSELTQRRRLDVRRQFSASPARPDHFRLGIGEVLDHISS